MELEYKLSKQHIKYWHPFGRCTGKNSVYYVSLSEYLHAKMPVDLGVHPCTEIRGSFKNLDAEQEMHFTVNGDHGLCFMDSKCNIERFSTLDEAVSAAISYLVWKVEQAPAVWIAK